MKLYLIFSCIPNYMESTLILIYDDYNLAQKKYNSLIKRHKNKNIYFIEEWEVSRD